MKSPLFVLSTPDIRNDPVISHLDLGFDVSLRPRLGTLASLPETSSSASVTKLNAAIYSSQSRHWFQTMDIPHEDLFSCANGETIASLATPLREKNWQLHDPLLIHTLPLWLSELEQVELLFYYSSPMHCAQELQEKWRFPIAYGLALWEYTILQACTIMQNEEVTLLSKGSDSQIFKTRLNSILNRLEISEPVDVSGLPAISEKEPIFELSENLNWISDRLEAGDIKSLASTELSASSSDILQYYGQLRAGYDEISKERDQLKKEAMKESREEKTSATELSPETDEELLQVLIQLRGSDQLEFYCHPESPVLQMLQEELLKQDSDQLIYLDCGEDEGAVYFMSSNLLGIELNQASV